MPSGLHGRTRLPERLVHDLQRRLWWHGIWDWGLMVFPPLFAVFYIVLSFISAGWLATEVMVFACAASLGLLVALALHLGSNRLPLATVARFIDDRVKGKDRFVTLTTIDSRLFPSALIQRLRNEAFKLLVHIDLKRDFPYRFRRSFFASMAVSLSLVLLTQLWLYLTVFRSPMAVSLNELSSVAQELSLDPLAAELGSQLMELKARLQEQGLRSAGNKEQVRELRRQLRYQLASGGEGGDRRDELLRQAAGTLEDLAKSQEKSGGPGGDLDARPAGDGTDKGREGAAQGKRQRGQDAAVGKNKEGRDKSRFRMAKEQDQGNGKSRLGGGEGKGKEQGSAIGSGAEAKGPQEGSEKDPLGQTPDRFYKSGEEKEGGIEGARYVIVELPEGKADSEGFVPESKGSKLQGPKVPIGNVPLPPRSRRVAPKEQQRIPLEYRRMLR